MSPTTKMTADELEKAEAEITRLRASEERLRAALVQKRTTMTQRTAREVEFEPGWLRRVGEDATVECAMMHDPQFHIHYGGRAELPLPKMLADRLYRLMDERFYAWTGQHLAEWQRGGPGQ